MTISGKKRASGLLGAAAIALAVATASSTTAMAQGDPNPGVLPVNSKPFGMTYDEWSAAWWEWSLAIDGPKNPIEDPDGRFTGEGQGGKVWFLAGTSSTAAGQLVERHVTIPTGNAIFFPILNSVWLTIPYPYPGVPDGDPPFSVRARSRSPGRDCHGSDDGPPRSRDRWQAAEKPDQLSGPSPVFTAILPAYNWFDVTYGFIGIDLDITAGLYPDTVSDGYWIMLTPFAKGQHTIHLRGENEFGFVTEVLYHVTVK